MLIDKNAGDAAFAQEFDRLAKPAAAVEPDEAEPGAGGVDVAIEVRVSQGLIDGADKPTGRAIRDNVREQLPIPQVGKDEDDAFARLGGLVKRRHVLDIDPGRDGLVGHRRELEGSKEICAKRGKMFAGEAAQFGW